VTATGEPTGREGDPLTPEGPVQIPPSPFLGSQESLKINIPGCFHVLADLNTAEHSS